MCVHPDSKLRALVNTSDCKPGGRGTHINSSANQAGLLRTLSDVLYLLMEMATRPNHKPGKPRDKGCMSVDANVLPGTCTVRAFRYTQPLQDLPQKV